MMLNLSCSEQDEQAKDSDGEYVSFLIEEKEHESEMVLYSDNRS